MKNTKKSIRSTQHTMKSYNPHLESKFEERGERKIGTDAVTKKKKKKGIII